MTSLSFTLLPVALLQLHDVLVCLSKFNESVSIEAEESFVWTFFFSSLVSPDTLLTIRWRFISADKSYGNMIAPVLSTEPDEVSICIFQV